MARKRKPLSPEQRAKKNARARELYAERRAAGLSPKQAKSRESSKLLDTPRQKPKTVPSASKPRRRRKQAPPVKGVTYSPKERKSAGDFEQYVARHLAANPDASARKILESYHAQGGQISNAKGYKIVRDMKANDKDFEKVRFKMYGPDDHPAANKKFLFPKRFMYLVRYEVEVEGQPDSFTQYVYIKSDFSLSAGQIAMKTIEEFQIGQELGKERYIAKRIIPNSITILWGVDRFQKSA